MKAVRRALREIAALELDLWSEDDAPLVAVDRSGGIAIQHDGEAQRPRGQSILGAACSTCSHPSLHARACVAPI